MLTSHFGIDDLETKKRLMLYRLANEDISILKSLKPFFDRHMTTIVDQFYDHLGQFPEMRATIENSGSSIERLKKTNPSYFSAILTGEFGLDYFESRLRVGKIHAEIGITPLLFFSGYSAYIDSIYALMGSTWGKSRKQALRCVQALQKAFNLDQELIIESYVEFVFIAKLQAVTGEVLSVVGDLHSESAVLSDSAATTGRVAQEVQLATNQVAQAITVQAESAGQISAAMTCISQSSSEVRESSRNQRDAIARANEGVLHIQKEVDVISADSQIWHELSTRMGAIESLKKTVEQTAQQVKELQSHSFAINNITKSITEIASQTNLLALNAAIEAARAGEHGRGFGVVADEVRKLAESSAQAALEITALIRVVQEGNSAMSTAMANTIGDVDEVLQITSRATTSLEGISQSAEKAAALKNIVSESMESVNVATTVIDEKLSQVFQHVDTATISVEQIAATAEENAAATEEMAASSTEAGEMVTVLVQGLQRLVDGIEKLNRVAEETNQSIGHGKPPEQKKTGQLKAA